MRAVICGVLSLVSGAWLSAAQGAVPYPERPIRYVIPSAAGGGPDTAARVVMAELGARVGQQVVIDNRPGGNGTIGTEVVAKATPDGYTIGHGNILTLGINRSVLPKLPYHPDHDLQPVVQMYFTPNLLAVAPSLPIKSVQDLIDYAKKNPDQLLFASAASGSSVHLAAELFKLMTGTRMVHVPFKAMSVAITDIVAGRVHLTFDNINSVGPHVKSGRLRGLAVTTAKRVPAFSDLPTLVETGLPGYEVTAWAGVIVPRGVSRAVVERLNKEVNATLESPQVREKLALQGLEIVGGSGEQFAAHIAKEAAKWADVVKRAGVKVD